MINNIVLLFKVSGVVPPFLWIYLHLVLHKAQVLMKKLYIYIYRVEDDKICCSFLNYFLDIWILFISYTSSLTVIQELKSILGEHGIPEKVISDNGPQYASDHCQQFAKRWNFDHITSAPNYSQSNGFAERMAETVKDTPEKATLTLIWHYFV